MSEVDVCDPDGSIESVDVLHDSQVIVARVRLKRLDVTVVGHARGLFFLSDGSEINLKNAFRSPAGYSEAFNRYIWLFLFDMEVFWENGRPFYTASGEVKKN